MNIIRGYNESMKSVRAFVRDSGECPYNDFLEEVKTSGVKTERILALVNLLPEYGFDLARNDYIDHVEDKIWELKPGPFRIFFFEDRNSFVLLNGYRKKSRKIPRGHLDEARRLYQEASR